MNERQKDMLAAGWMLAVLLAFAVMVVVPKLKGNF